MASQYEGRTDLHFDATTATVEIQDFGEIPGVQKFKLDPGKQDPQTVGIIGSEVEVGVTPGALEPGDTMMDVYLGPFADWLKNTVQAQLGNVPYRTHIFIFAVTWAHLDEEENALPPVTASFKALIKTPQSWDTDRTQGGQPIIIGVPIRIIGRVTLNGVKL